MRPTIDFFFFYGSIYSYLAVMRIDEMASAADVDVKWRPFNLREIMIEQNSTAVVRNPVRMSYCWRDVERRAARHEIDFVSKPPYPVDPELLALRVGSVAAAEGWCGEYNKATFRSWFVDHNPAGVGSNVEDVLLKLNRPAKEILARVALPEAAERLKKETDAARKLGIFGAPTFVVGEEIFWGDDRLEDAVDWALSAQRAQLGDPRNHARPKSAPA